MAEMGKPFALPSIVGRAVTPGRGPGCDKMGKLDLNHWIDLLQFPSRL